VHVATRSLLDSLASTIKENSIFRKHVEFWEMRGKHIQNLEQLVLCYFSSIEVPLFGPIWMFTKLSVV
jgi:hypothetical protein